MAGAVVRIPSCSATWQRERDIQSVCARSACEWVYQTSTGFYVEHCDLCAKVNTFSNIRIRRPFACVLWLFFFLYYYLNMIKFNVVSHPDDGFICLDSLLSPASRGEHIQSMFILRDRLLRTSKQADIITYQRVRAGQMFDHLSLSLIALGRRRRCRRLLFDSKPIIAAVLAATNELSQLR